LFFGSASPSPARGNVGSNVRRLTFDESRRLAGLEQLLGIEQSEKLDHLRHQPRPSRLVARAEPRAVIAMEILV
jgi:hypothetical protein